jgi:hypothetical protein
VARRPGATAAFAVYMLWVSWIGAHHQPWFDEAQAWLIARDNGLWSLFAQGVRYEGTAALWHALLFLLQRLGFPYGGLWLISASLCAAGAALVLYRAPFPFWLRVGLIFSYFFGYQYAVVARSYALDALILPLLAVLFPRRTERPLLYGLLLGLMAETNAHSFVLAAALALEWAWAGRDRMLARRSRTLAAVGLYALLALAAVLQAWPPKDINFLIPKPGEDHLMRAAIILSEAFVDRADLWSFTGPSLPWRIGGWGLTLFILAPSAWLWIKARRIDLAAGMFGSLLGFSILKYGNAWHAGVVFLAFLFCLWISWPAVAGLGPRMRLWLTGALAFLVLAQVWDAAAAGLRDRLTAYSPARAVAEALRRAPPGRIGVAGFKAFAIQPYFDDNRFANYERGAAKPAYYLWRRGETPIPGLTEATWRATAASGYDRLLLSNFNVMGWNGPARYILDARRAGYCPSALFEGAMVWKTYELERDDMMLFDRCAVHQGTHARSP